LYASSISDFAGYLPGGDPVQSRQKISALEGKINQLEKKEKILQQKVREVEESNNNYKKESLH